MQTLLDLTKAFEAVPHPQLADAAKKFGYSPTILRMSLEAYRLERTVGCEAAYAKPVVATRGITAGSSHATSDLRLLPIGIVKEMARRHPEVDLTLYVDDLTVACVGDPVTAARRCATVVDAVVGVLQDDRLPEEVGGPCDSARHY